MVIKVKYNGEWVKIPYLSAGSLPAVEEAPIDGKQYARQDGVWTVVNIPEVDLTDIYSKIDANTTALTTKVNIVEGKDLSTNDYTTEEKQKLAGIAIGAEVNVSSDWNAVSGITQILNKPTLSTVALSGDYFDLLNKPALAAVATSGNYADLSNKPTIPTVDVTKAYVDTQITDTNEAITATNQAVTALTGVVDTKANAADVYTKVDVYTKTEAYNKAEVDAKVSSVYRVRGSVASFANLPATGVAIGDVYNVLDGGSNYVAIAIEPTIEWDKLSETIDLTPYALNANLTALETKVDTTFEDVYYSVNAELAKKVDKVDGKGLSSNDYTTVDKNKLDFMYGQNTVTTLANLPVTKRSINANLSAASTLSLATALEEGQELQIRCVPSTVFTLTIPSTGGFTSMSGTSLTTVVNVPFEINVWCYKAGAYSIAILEKV